MNSEEPPDREAEVARQINALFKDVPKRTRGSLLRPDEKRFRFSMGLFFLALFCLVIAGFPWPQVQFLDRLMWVGFAFVLLALGGWQLDKSNKERLDKPEPDDDAEPPLPPSGETSTTQSRSLRQVK